MARLNRLDAPPPFELWSADLSAEPAAGELETLSPDEHERAARFVFARDRRRFLAAHVALRRLLAERTGATAGGLRFATGPFGKPSLEGTPAYAFNLTHSEDLALIAMARDGEVGVDVEMLRAVDDASDLAGRNFTSAECTQLTSEVAQDQDLAFLRCWTRKEACLKAIGSGLSIAPETFETGAGGEARVVRIVMPGDVASVAVHTLALPAGAVGALAHWASR